MPAPENLVNVYLIFNHRDRSRRPGKSAGEQAAIAGKRRQEGAKPGQAIFMEMEHFLHKKG